MIPQPVQPVPEPAVAIVTGGSWDDRRELASELARRSYAVVFGYLSDQHEAEAVVEAILAAGGTALAVRADITDELDVERLFGETVAAFGRIDVVVHAERRGAGVVYAQAARGLREGGAILGIAGADALPPAVAETLLARGITLNMLGEFVVLLDRPG